MVFELKCKFLGQEEKQSKNGNNYNVVSLFQGIDTLKVISDLELDLEFGQDFIAYINYDVTYKNMRLIGVKND